MTIDLARIHIEFYKPLEFIHGEALIRYMTNDTMFTERKRMWWPPSDTLFKNDGTRLEITRDCAFLVFTFIGEGSGMLTTGEMDFAVTQEGLLGIIGDDVPRIIEMGRNLATYDEHGHASATFIVAFGYMSGLQLVGKVPLDETLLDVIKKDTR